MIKPGHFDWVYTAPKTYTVSVTFKVTQMVPNITNPSGRGVLMEEEGGYTMTKITNLVSTPPLPPPITPPLTWDGVTNHLSGKY